jgi:nucleoside permease NupC
MTKQDSYCHTVFTAVKIMKDAMHKFINLSQEGTAFIFRAECIP